MSDMARGSRKAGFLPEGAQRFLRRRAVEATGLALFTAAALLALALASYRPEDPSANVAVAAPA